MYFRKFRQSVGHKNKQSEAVLMSPVSTEFNTEVTVSIGLQKGNVFIVGTSIL